MYIYCYSILIDFASNVANGEFVMSVFTASRDMMNSGTTL